MKLPGKIITRDIVAFCAILFAIGAAIGTMLHSPHFLIDGEIAACLGISMTIGMIFFLRSSGSSIYWGKDRLVPFLVEYADFTFSFSRLLGSLAMYGSLAVISILPAAILLYDFFQVASLWAAGLLLVAEMFFAFGLLAGLRWDIVSKS